MPNQSYWPISYHQVILNDSWDWFDSTVLGLYNVNCTTVLSLTWIVSYLIVWLLLYRRGHFYRIDTFRQVLLTVHDIDRNCLNINLMNTFVIYFQSSRKMYIKNMQTGSKMVFVKVSFVRSFCVKNYIYSNSSPFLFFKHHTLMKSM